MKRLIVLALVSLITLGVSAQQTKTASKKEQTVTIQTNGVCQKCADRFNENVPYFKGVKSYSYDTKTSKLTITYDSKKTNPDQLRQQVSKLGYNADNVKADPDARAKLPACCRAEKGKGGCGGCGNHGNGQGCGNHGQAKEGGHHHGGEGCGNHGQAKEGGHHHGGEGCENHGNGKKCDKHHPEHSKAAVSPKDNNTKQVAPAKQEVSKSK